MRKQTLSDFLKDKDEAVRRAAADALNKAADEVKAEMQKNISSNFEEHTGKMRNSVEFDYATPERPKVLIKSEYVGDAPAPDKQGKINPAMKGRYKAGSSRDKTPLGRILEFSPRRGKPWFYTAWYNKQKTVEEEIRAKVGEAWSK